MKFFRNTVQQIRDLGHLDNIVFHVFYDWELNEIQNIVRMGHHDVNEIADYIESHYDLVDVEESEYLKSLQVCWSRGYGPSITAYEIEEGDLYR